jgi:hypothetical protein
MINARGIRIEFQNQVRLAASADAMQRELRLMRPTQSVQVVQVSIGERG